MKTYLAEWRDAQHHIDELQQRLDRLREEYRKVESALLIISTEMRALLSRKCADCKHATPTKLATLVGSIDWQDCHNDEMIFVGHDSLHVGPDFCCKYWEEKE